ncbi:hypothetical protein [Parasitella parasitica]|uniref:Uncharacterized protein n=1 Tax=Parasitella parasitica TaxID=35722 RepID=A0A0B7NFM3_9FUNG|nr:hypothetical protein [Parasitella parasitica]
MDIRIPKSNDGFLIHRKNLVHNHPCEERNVVDHNFYIKSVYNAVAQLRAEVLDGRTPVQMLVDPVTEMTDYSFDIKFN